jgi:hypothetical protein
LSKIRLVFVSGTDLKGFFSSAGFDQKDEVRASFRPRCTGAKWDIDCTGAFLPCSNICHAAKASGARFSETRAE